MGTGLAAGKGAAGPLPQYYGSALHHVLRRGIFRLVNQPERDPEKEKTLLELAKTHRRAAWKIPLEHKSQKLQALMVSYCPHLGAKVWKLVRWVKGLKN